MLRLPAVSRLLYICKELLSEALRFLPLMVGSQASLAAEILFLRKQLAFYQERKIKARRVDDAARLSMPLSKLFKWKNALIHVKAGYLDRRHRKAFQLFWCWAELEVQHDIEDGVDQAEREYVDQLNIDSDGVDEVITSAAHYESWSYKIWRFVAKRGRWQKAYERLGGGC